MITSIKLTVLFNEPFWIGVFEVCENDGYKVCKVTFGAEPKDEEIHQFILKEFKNLKFSSIMTNLNEKLVLAFGGRSTFFITIIWYNKNFGYLLDRRRLICYNMNIIINRLGLGG